MNKKRPLSAEQAFTRYAAACAMSEMCAADLIDKMRRRGLSREDAERVVEQLRDKGFVDDRRYATAFAHDKFHLHRWGRIKIARELQHKRIDRELIDAALDEAIPVEDYKLTLLRLLRDKWAGLRGKEPEQVRAAMVRYAVSRGFEPTLVFEAIKKINPECNDLDEMDFDYMDLD